MKFKTLSFPFVRWEAWGFEFDLRGVACALRRLGTAKFFGVFFYEIIYIYGRKIITASDISIDFARIVC